MTGTRAVKPNKAFRALIERHPEQSKPLLDDSDLTRFMNVWAKEYAKNPELALLRAEIWAAERAEA
jgi:hypothetical protein